jgi:molybdate transport system substrate-binding protein
MPPRPARRALLAAPLLAAPAAAQAAAPLVFAAASLAEALRAQAQAWSALGHPAPRLSFAASSALARQIEQGAPADIFASADEAWMDHLAARDLIAPGTRVSPIGNTLVLVAPAARPLAFAPARGADLLAALAGGRLAVGDPAHVPAGRYAEAALRWMGQWEALSPRLARAENVRAALLLVERGEAPLGIVYATDAAASRGVVVAGTFPRGSHPPIAYPFALTRRGAANPLAAALHAHLTGPAALPLWQRFGFLPAA